MSPPHLLYPYQPESVFVAVIGRKKPRTIDAVTGHSGLRRKKHAHHRYSSRYLALKNLSAHIHPLAERVIVSNNGLQSSSAHKNLMQCACRCMHACKCVRTQTSQHSAIKTNRQLTGRSSMILRFYIATLCALSVKCTDVRLRAVCVCVLLVFNCVYSSSNACSTYEHDDMRPMPSFQTCVRLYACK